MMHMHDALGAPSIYLFAALLGIKSIARRHFRQILGHINKFREEGKAFFSRKCSTIFIMILFEIAYKHSLENAPRLPTMLIVHYASK